MGMKWIFLFNDLSWWIEVLHTVGSSSAAIVTLGDKMSLTQPLLGETDSQLMLQYVFNMEAVSGWVLRNATSIYPKTLTEYHPVHDLVSTELWQMPEWLCIWPEIFHIWPFCQVNSCQFACDSWKVIINCCSNCAEEKVKTCFHIYPHPSQVYVFLPCDVNHLHLYPLLHPLCCRYTEQL